MRVLKYTKKPVEVEAIPFDGTVECAQFIRNWAAQGGVSVTYPSGTNAPLKLYIPTLEGTMMADINDFVIKGVAGEFYPCKPDIFEATYEEAPQ